MSRGWNIVTVGPRPLPRPWATAITTYSPLVSPEFDPDARGVKRWLNGVKFQSFGCDKIVGVALDPCVERISERQTLGGQVAFNAFGVEVGVHCSTLSFGEDQSALQEYVRAHTEVSRSAVIAAQLETGGLSPDPANPDPSLAGDAQVISGTFADASSALAVIEDALGDLLDGGQGMIHMTPGTLIRLQAGGGLRFDGRLWYTATGHIVIADAGHQGVSAVTGALAQGESWIYGTGPVFLKVDDVLSIVGDSWENFDWERNELYVDVEQYALLMFDPCSAVAARYSAPTITAVPPEE